MTDSLFQPAASRFSTNGSGPKAPPSGVTPFELVDAPEHEFFTPEPIIPTRSGPVASTDEPTVTYDEVEVVEVEAVAAYDQSGPDHAETHAPPAPHTYVAGEQPPTYPAVTPATPAATAPTTMQPNGSAPEPATTSRVDYLPMPSTNDLVNAPVLVIEHRHIEPTTMQPAPPEPSWTLQQLLSVLGVMAVIALLGSAIGWINGRGAEPTYAARSELIYFLEDAVPDGFLREDRRILTQLVTIESQAVLQPVAAEFDTTVEDLRKAIDVSVVDLSEVIRLDVVDADSDRALAINQAVLAGYRTQAERTFSRTDSRAILETRDQLVGALKIADEQSQEILVSEAQDVELRVIEDSLTRELEISSQRFQNLSSIADGLLVESTTIDDTASISRQIDAANQTIARLESELLAVRNQREVLAQSVRDVPDEFAYQTNEARRQDVGLSVREESIQTQITTAAERARRLEGLRSDSLVNNEVRASAAPVSERLATTAATMDELESQLLNVRTKRTQVAQRAAALPSLTREVERLEAELRSVETKLGDLALTEQAPSPIEVLTTPLALEDPVGNPAMKFAALGFLASLPFAALAGAALRSRQRKRRY